MRTIFVFISLVWLMSSAKSTPTKIFVNSLGYKPGSVKKATIVGAIGKYSLKDAKSDETVYKGELSGPFQQDDVNQTVYVADFSEFSETGDFFIVLDNGSQSISFPINENVYDFTHKTSMRAFYLWRCGTEVSGSHNGDDFKQNACHLNDGYYDFTEFGETHADGTGGWHDAGDYGKYIVNGGISLGQLFMGWQDFQQDLENTKLDIPNNSNELPDYLDELKWETDWFLKMQYPDSSGRISHKLTRTGFSGFIMPDQDKEKRYFTPWGTDATAYFAATMALASRNFMPYNAEYAKTCYNAANLSYAFLEENPEHVQANLEGFNTGAYQPNKTGGLIWAAAEMWESTGNEKYLKDFESRIQSEDRLVDMNWDWWGVKNLGVFTYLLSDKKRDNNELFNEIKNELILVADSIVEHVANDVYGRPSAIYEWGCNGTIARMAQTLYVASKFNPDKKYKDAAEQIVAHIFGRNYYGRSYVTGLGVNPPLKPHDRRCGADGIENPWPGYIVGGGHTATDWVDEEASYSHNEICINWQASLVYLMSWVAFE